MCILRGRFARGREATSNPQRHNRVRWQPLDCSCFYGDLEIGFLQHNVGALTIVLGQYDYVSL